MIPSIFGRVTILVSLMFGAPAMAYQISDLNLDVGGENLLVRVDYVGGCLEHNWSWQIEPCQSEPSGRWGSAVRLLDSGWQDTCETAITQIVSIPVSALQCSQRPLDVTVRASRSFRTLTIE